MSKYETIIGLEIHVELKTDTKLFCGCATTFGQEPNTQCCPVCLGLGGATPVLNRKALAYAIMAGCALNCQIQDIAKFDRKCYFYPDLPKAYQTSQDDLPIAVGGYVEFEDEEAGPVRVRIRQAHLEEETGKSLHEGDNILQARSSMLDYNRCGIPLLEIVTDPDLASPAQAREFLEALKSILEYTGVSDCKMEEGSLRCDANISLRPKGSTKFGAKVEIKNMNSFRAVQRALEYEEIRQRELLDAGEEIDEETRHWDEGVGKTLSMRKKEAPDYRFIPEVEIRPVIIDASWVETLRDSLPELPNARRQRFIAEYSLPSYDAAVLTNDKFMADFFEEVIKVYEEPKQVSNWLMGEVLRLVRDQNTALEGSSLTPKGLGELLALLSKGKINGPQAKEILAEMFSTGEDPKSIAKKRGFEQISDDSALLSVIDQVLVEHQDAVESFKSGKDRAFGFLMGQIMAKTKGKADPRRTKDLLTEKLSQM
ncbi:MAG: Asp-tRNA(Asn)/Glu-tRNA(Gln) amidotransferase subunit GatB [Limnochordia bacterium]|nr:Asp-tRNA(Asn)/Glu-tRNA(Gln) amidotransferase subunit GatB [Limnochordia bacterium]